MYVTIGKNRIEVASLAEATAEYQKVRDAAWDRGAPRWPRGATVSTGYTISQNGRVWLGKVGVMEADGSPFVERDYAIEVAP